MTIEKQGIQVFFEAEDLKGLDPPRSRLLDEVKPFSGLPGAAGEEHLHAEILQAPAEIHGMLRGTRPLVIAEQMKHLHITPPGLLPSGLWSASVPTAEPSLPDRTHAP